MGIANRLRTIALPPPAVLAVALLALLAAPACALEPVHETALGVAIDGYDAVAYFDGAAPAKGSSEHTVEWQGATWRFTSAEHRRRFVAEPERYAPRYGGYCAWAVGHGYTAPGDPEAWSIVDGKLYLNYNQEVKAMWTPDAAKWIAEGDVNWPRLLAGEKPKTDSR